HLGDFGLARPLETLRSRDPEYAGTLAYMPPEVVRARDEANPLRPDHRGDIYALGVILYQCLTGRLPFQGPSCEETAAQIVQGGAVPPRLLNPAVPPRLEEACLRALAKDPAARFATAADLAGALRAALPGTPTWLSRRWPWLAGAAGAVAALIVLVVLFFRR